MIDDYAEYAAEHLTVPCSRIWLSRDFHPEDCDCKGTEREWPLQQPCQQCRGSGAVERCADCREKRLHETRPSLMAMYPCDECDGRGWTFIRDFDVVVGAIRAVGGYVRYRTFLTGDETMAVLDRGIRGLVADIEGYQGMEAILLAVARALGWRYDTT